MEVRNQNKIDRLAGEIGAENVPVLLEIFLGELNTYIESLRSDSLADRNQYLKEISHALKSSAASFGAEKLCSYAVDVDAAAKHEESTLDSQFGTGLLSVLEETRDDYATLL